MFGAAQDTTHRKEAEVEQARLLKELEDVNRELTDFASIVSHDLKAPLRAIGSLAEWISMDYSEKLGPEGKEQLSMLLGRVRRMNNLIDGILRYSRLGRTKEEKVEVDLNALVAEVIDLVRPPEQITVTVETHLPEVICERTRIAQVFQNLLSNAIKFSDKPVGDVSVGCVGENGHWKFWVKDNGPGVDEKYYEKIFQIFQTLAPRDQTENTGVGLAIVKRIVEMHGGRIWLESVVGQGCTFYFTCPKNNDTAKNTSTKEAA
jgi:signal transduction histidine kinase